MRVPRALAAATAISMAGAWAAVGSVPALAGQAAAASPADHVRQQEWWLSKLHVTQAWQTTRGAGVTVALLDTGADAAHPDLTGSVIAGPDLTKAFRGAGPVPAPAHGTAMASLIVGHGHGSGGGAGIIGVAPAAKLLSVKVTLDAGDPALTSPAVTSRLPGAIASGIRYAVANGAQVIDLPLDPGQAISALSATPAPMPPPAGTTPTPAQAAAAAAAGGSAAEKAAIAFALSKGVILVAPGGDNHESTDAVNFPASYPGVISVGAFNNAVVKAPFSSHQPYVTLTAAGNGMTAAVPPGGYAAVSSTSAASAVVTGIAALIKSQYPELTPAQVTQALKNGTVFRPKGGQQNGSGAGTADAAKALTAAGSLASPAPSRAGAGAASSSMPAAPAPPVISNALTSKLVRAAVISLIVLIVLLVPTLIYGSVVRRRVRAAQKARETAAAPPARAPYAHNAAGTVDPMREYFPPAAAAPAAIAGAAAAGPAASGSTGLATSTAAGNGESRAGTPAAAGVAAGGAAAAASGLAAVLPRSLVSAARLPVARPPAVSGSPPWDPAPEPASELPWAARSVPTWPRRNAPAHLPAPALPASHDDQAGTAEPPTPGSNGGQAGARVYVPSPQGGSGNRSMPPPGFEEF